MELPAFDDKNKRRNRTVDLSSLVYGKVPPQDRELEKSILGAILMHRGAYETAAEIVGSQCFYVHAHQLVFQSFQNLFKKRIPIDLLTVTEELRSLDQLEVIGGPYFLTEVTMRVASAADLDSWCRKIYEHFIKRELIILAGEIMGDGYEPSVDAFDLIDTLEAKLRILHGGIAELQRDKISSIAARVFEKYVNAAENAKNGVVDNSLVYTRIHDWDQFNGPLFQGGVYIVAGRPGMGKGVLLTQMIRNISPDIPVGVLNGEMTNEQLIIRIGCNMLGISNELWKVKPIDRTPEQIQLVHDAMEATQSLLVEIDDTLDIDRARLKMIIWVKLLGVKVIFLDFITMYKNKSSKRYLSATEQAEYVMDILASTAKELQVPIIAFAQLNRESIAKGGVREPNLSDLKRAGEIEEKAFQVVFLHRPEYYTPDQTVDEMGESIHGLMYMICAKHRDGQVFRLKKKFIGDSSRIEEWQSDFPVYKPQEDLSFNGPVTIFRLPYKDDEGFDEAEQQKLF